MAHDGQTETFKFEFQTNIMTKQKEMENKKTAVRSGTYFACYWYPVTQYYLP